MKTGGILRGEEDARQANFLELFFDLVLVFALNGVVTRVVQDLFSESVWTRWLSLLYTVVLALPLLWLWTTTAHITSRFSHRSRWIQLIVLLSTFGLLIMAASPTAILVITFLSTVLMWRIYFYRAGQVLAEAIALSANREAAGRTVGTAHVLMVLGSLGVAAGSKIALAHPGGHTRPAWLAVILGGPAVFLLGRAKLERIVFNRVSRRRMVGIGTLFLLAPPLVLAPPLLAATTAVAVLLGIAVADARHAAGRPPEAPSPAV